MVPLWILFFRDLSYCSPYHVTPKLGNGFAAVYELSWAGISQMILI